jgi:cystathionine beta-lyase/cystathionine gamma-synthase
MSTFSQKTLENKKGFEDSRSGNPTRFALEKSIACIENGKHGLDLLLDLPL